MTLFDVFRTQDGRFWFVLWDIAMSKPIFISNLYTSLPELLSGMILTATEKEVDLSLMIDSLVVPAKFKEICIWKKKGMFVQTVDVLEQLGALLGGSKSS